MGSLWQQAGRGGRGTRPSIAIFIALDSPLDQVGTCTAVVCGYSGRVDLWQGGPMQESLDHLTTRQQGWM
jgi:hypothetical protein